MITEAQIRQLVEEKIEGTDLFIVDVNVRPGNKIEIQLDRESGLTVDNCREVSRHVEHSLDRESEDFSLDVSSPGVGKPLKVLRQYFKNTGRNVEVETNDGNVIKGTLNAADEEGITVITEVKVEIPGKKGKKKAEQPVQLTYGDIKETKIVISFK